MADSMHPEPKTPAEDLARHLETNYGLQLDPARHGQLVSEIQDSLEAYRDSFAPEPEAEGEPDAQG